MKITLNFEKSGYTLSFIFSFLFCMLFLQSCNKHASVDDPVKISVKFIGVSSDNQSIGDNGLSKTASVYARETGSQLNDMQYASSPFSNHYDFNLTVAEEQFARFADDQETLKLLNKEVSTNWASTLSPLDANVRYRMVVYKHDNPSSASSDATYVADYEYTGVGPVGGNPSFYLNDGEYYTFVFYSTNQQTTPAINTSLKLNSATLPSLDGNQNFMFQKITRMLTVGDNLLEVELLHKFTEVTINLDASDISGTIESIGDITLPHYAQANANLNTGAITYVGAATTKVIPFIVASNKITATTGSVKICNPTITTLNLPEMRILSATSDKTATPAAVTGIAIDPGMKYTLNGAIERKPIVVGTTSWAPANLLYNASGLTDADKYKFAPAQNSAGSLWYNNRLDIPSTAGTGNAPYTEANDPCTKILTHGGSWITPIAADYTALNTANTAVGVFSANVTIGSAGAYTGIFVGTSTVPTVATTIDDFLFLNRSGSQSGTGTVNLNNGHYWLRQAANNGYFTFTNTKVLSSGTGLGNGGNVRRAIRCVKKT